MADSFKRRASASKVSFDRAVSRFCCSRSPAARILSSESSAAVERAWRAAWVSSGLWRTTRGAPFATRSPSRAGIPATVADSGARSSPPAGGSREPSERIGTTRSLRAVRAVDTGTPLGPRNATIARITARRTATTAAQRQGIRNSGSSLMPRETRSLVSRTAEDPDLLLDIRAAFVIVEPGVIQDFLADEDAKCVSELQMLDEEIVLGLQIRPRHRRLEVEGEPLLDAGEARAPREVQKERQIEGHRRRENRVAAEEVDLDLHGLAEPAEDVDVVPPLLRVSPRRVVLDSDLVEILAVELAVDLGLENRVQDRDLGDLLRTEGTRVVQDLAVAVAEDVRREPAFQAQHPGFESGRDDRFHHRLTRLEVLSRDRKALRLRQLHQGRDIHAEIGRAVGEGDTGGERRVGVDHRGGDLRRVVLQSLLEGGERLVRRTGLEKNFRRAAPDRDRAVELLSRAEVLHVLHQRFGQMSLGRTGLDVLAVEIADVSAVENARPGRDGLELRAHLREHLGREHAGAPRRLVGVIRKDVPGSEDEVGRLGQRHEFLDRNESRVGALAEADLLHLCQRAEGPREPLVDQIDAGDEGRRDSSETRQEDSELPLGRDDVLGQLGVIRRSVTHDTLLSTLSSRVLLPPVIPSLSPLLVIPSAARDLPPSLRDAAFCSGQAPRGICSRASSQRDDRQQ